MHIKQTACTQFLFLPADVGFASSGASALSPTNSPILERSLPPPACAMCHVLTSHHVHNSHFLQSPRATSASQQGRPITR
ncbi:hypothetical protein Scep_017666 [Stephania cephalantha]|uniref:Uncharacterized protein n=1 Tax=Stephania cephalantha TaxID=152367 RepID=A0AAP0NUF8_9MAGN